MGTGAITINVGTNLNFYAGSSAGSATITNNGGLSSLSFNDTSTAGSAAITNNNGLSFNGTSTADSATITNNSGGVLRISGLTNGGISVGALSGAGNVSLGSKTLTVGGLGTDTTISGVISGTGTLTKTGTGTLTLTNDNTYTGTTTINAGAIAARGSALGTGAVSVASGATLGVGQTANNTLSPLAGGAQTLSVSSLTVAAASGNLTPALTFNLFDGGVSDKLNLTGTGTTLSFSSAGGAKFLVGFASGTGGGLFGGTYDIFSFTNPSASNTFGLDTTNANNSFAARGTGNLATTTGTFQWVKSGDNITGLQYVLGSAATAATPEPGSLVLLLSGLTSFAGIAFQQARLRRGIR